jgi:hypothetical protein
MISQGGVNFQTFRQDRSLGFSPGAATKKSSARSRKIPARLGKNPLVADATSQRAAARP